MAENQNGRKGFQPGRKKGAVNKVTAKHREMISDFLSEKASKEQLCGLFDELEPKDQATFLVKMFNFVVPRMERHEIEPLNVTPQFAREVLNTLLAEEDGAEGNS